MHGILREFYKAQKAIAAAQHDDAVSKLSPTNQLLQRCLDNWTAERWEGISQANTDALLYGMGVYHDAFTNTEYVILADFYDVHPGLQDEGKVAS